MANKQQKIKICLTLLLSFAVIGLYAVIISYSAKPVEISHAQSVEVTTSLIDIIARLFSLDLSADEMRLQIERWDGFVRKAAHFSEYALLGALVYAIFLLWERRGLGMAFVSLSAVVLMAAADEILQYFVPGRSGQYTDVILDGSGGLFGMLIIRVIWSSLPLRKNAASSKMVT